MIQLLFDAVEAASEIAFMLKANWDGFNGVNFHQDFDIAALKMATKLTETKFCNVNDCCYLPDRPQDHMMLSFSTYALPFQGLPLVPTDLATPLWEAFSRFEVFSGVNECPGPKGEIISEEIQQDRQKYPHLVTVLKDGYIINDLTKNCIEYMHIVSGIERELCVTYLYMRELDVLTEFYDMEVDIFHTYHHYLKVVSDIENEGNRRKRV